MTFYEKFTQLCDRMNVKPNSLGKTLKISSGSFTNWKNGALPDSNSVIKLSQYFGCPSDYLLGLSDTPTASTAQTLTADEAELLSLFRALPYKLQQRYIGRMQESADDEARARKKDA